MARPIFFQFVFQNNDTVKFNNHQDSLLKSYCEDIIEGKRKLESAKILFATGETLTFKNNEKGWSEIRITFNNKEISIPDTLIQKIPVILFNTFKLCWDGNIKQAFSSYYFSLGFDIGTNKEFNKYPQLSLVFIAQKFSEALVLRQMNENSYQWKSF